MRKTDGERERHSNIEEMARPGAALDELAAEAVNPKALAIVRLLALTGWMMRRRSFRLEGGPEAFNLSDGLTIHSPRRSCYASKATSTGFDDGIREGEHWRGRSER